MTDFTSDSQQISFSANKVFDFLSDLNNLEKVQPMLPKDSVSLVAFDTDSCRFKAGTIGTIAARIVERDPNKTIKLISEQSPVPFTCWIQLVEAGPEKTSLTLIVKADIPFFLKGMVVKPLENAIQKLAEALATYSY